MLFQRSGIFPLRSYQKLFQKFIVLDGKGMFSNPFKID